MADDPNEDIGLASKIVLFALFVFIAAVVLLLGSVFMILLAALSPLYIVAALIGEYVWWRKTGVLSEQGISFRRAYGQCLIPWSAIREVILKREPKAFFYIVVAAAGHGELRRYSMKPPADSAALERALEVRNIRLRVHDWRRREPEEPGRFSPTVTSDGSDGSDGSDESDRLAP